ncbi:murein hydrolase activator EnvC family protein [Alkaliphilus serpentinus]|uniref:M23 family metallopeptidase n=1 Tax=Alkaliphilus serpentinus TaxID=1482731 RepID=A0A833HQ47_9FIRM|nr:M23 family metallopeptidase [Alkaliphilus serpentinus]KAB3531435.1 M23 family metallopeptidase [Alkaliphilus serpentinus]
MKGLKRRPIGYYSSNFKDKYQPPLQLFIKSYPKRFIAQAITAIMIFCCLLTIRFIDNKFEKSLFDNIQGGLNRSFNYKGTYNAVVGWGEKIVLRSQRVVSVFNIDGNKKEFILPMSGTIVSRFKDVASQGDNPLKGILIQGNDDKVLVSEEGVILEKNHNKTYGHYIVLKHKGELISVYKYLEEVYVEINQRVNKGDILGRTSNKLLYEVWYRKEPQDPMEFINLDAITNL